MRLMKHYRVCFVLACIVLTGCGGDGGGGGGGPTPAAREIITLATIPSGGRSWLTLASGRVYFNDYNFHKVYSVPSVGGDVVTHLDMFASLAPIRHAINSLFMTGTGGLHSIPDNAVNATSTTLLWAAGNNVVTMWLVVDDTNVYWFTDDYDIATTSLTTNIYSKPLAGGATQHLGTIAGGHAIKISQSIDSLFISTGSSAGGGIYVIQKSGGTAVQVISTTIEGPSGSWVKGDVLYFFYYGLYSYNLLTGVLIQIFDTGTNPYLFLVDGELYVDDTHVYWTEGYYGQGYGAVRRVPIASGPVETLYYGDWCWDITGDGSSIYWTTGKSILKTTK